MSLLWKQRKLCAAATTALLFSGGAAHAATAILDFGVIAPTGGSIAYVGGSNALMGSGISVDNVVGQNTALHTGLTSTCLTCTLTFTSGNFSSYDNINNTWYFNGGGAISIVGGIDFSDNSNQPDIAVGTTLLSGAFSAASVTKLPTGFFDFRIAAGAFNDTKNPDLLGYYGLPSGPYAGGLNLSFSATPTASGNGFTSTQVFSGDIVNTPVPIPGAAWLLGSALAGLGAMTRRRRQMT